jgi:serine/threonine protein kinase
VRRFQREAAALRELRSEHTVRIHEAGACDDGVMFIAMEHLDGADLDRIVNARGPLPPERAVALMRQACAALAEAHARGIVHRDVKPSNLFLMRRSTRGDFLKVLDFGIARRIVGDETRITMDGDALGTPHFMAPETFQGADPDPQVDVWGAGATLFFLLTARRPFDGKTDAALVAAAMSAEIPPALDAYSNDPRRPRRCGAPRPRP